MKTLLISLFMILISISAYAEGAEAEILTGDTIGMERGIVTEIDRASITIQRGKTKTRIPVIYGFEE